jgi:hypothetical protein
LGVGGGTTGQPPVGLSLVAGYRRKDKSEAATSSGQKSSSTVWRRLWERFNSSCKKKNLEVVTGRTRLSSTVDFHRSEFMGSRSGLIYSKSIIISFGFALGNIESVFTDVRSVLSSSKTFCTCSLRLQKLRTQDGVWIAVTVGNAMNLVHTIGEVDPCESIIKRKRRMSQTLIGTKK